MPGDAKRDEPRKFLGCWIKGFKGEGSAEQDFSARLANQEKTGQQVPGPAPFCPVTGIGLALGDRCELEACADFKSAMILWPGQRLDRALTVKPTDREPEVSVRGICRRQSRTGAIFRDPISAPAPNRYVGHSFLGHVDHRARDLEASDAAEGDRVVGVPLDELFGAVQGITNPSLCLDPTLGSACVFFRYPVQASGIKKSRESGVRLAIRNCLRRLVLIFDHGSERVDSLSSDLSEACAHAEELAEESGFGLIKERSGFGQAPRPPGQMGFRDLDATSGRVSCESCPERLRWIHPSSARALRSSRARI